MNYCGVKLPYFMQNVNTRRRIFFLFPNQDKVPTNLIQEKFDFILMHIFIACVQTITKLWVNQSLISSARRLKFLLSELIGMKFPNAKIHLTQFQKVDLQVSLEISFSEKYGEQLILVRLISTNASKELSPHCYGWKTEVSYFMCMQPVPILSKPRLLNVPYYRLKLHIAEAKTFWAVNCSDDHLVIRTITKKRNDSNNE